MDFTFKPYVVNSENTVKEISFKIQKNGKITSFSAVSADGDKTVKEIVLLDIKNPFSADTKVYGEGYSMLSQYSGTVEDMKCIGCFDDTVHYKLPKKEGLNTVFNMALFNENGTYTLIGFSSCFRFSGEIRFNKDVLQIVLNTENKTFFDGKEVKLEDIYIATSDNREELLADFAREIEKNHPRLKFEPVPDGWCSWYCFGPHVTEDDILKNLDNINELGLNMRFVQIDDGYQRRMGDWLTMAESFGSDMKSLCDKIIEKGFEPAIWVAPFIAEEDSEVFKAHPEWFIKDKNGQPLSSDKFTFGGWRRAPWYMLDPTNPEVYNHLKDTFAYMRKNWGSRYFKLDANMWGAFAEGVRYNDEFTSVQSYRLGMKAILEGAGEGCFLLGCNAPMWHSIGAVHGNRLTGDISRSFDVFKSVAIEGFHRNWQNNKLWINDPDCVTVESSYLSLVDAGGRKAMLNADITDDEFLFHATYICAVGGMVLSGDDLSNTSLERLDVLKYLLSSEHISAKFDDDSFKIGRKTLNKKEILCLFNWNDSAEDLKVDVNGQYSVYDVWHKKDMGLYEDSIEVKMMPRSGLVLECVKKSD